MTSEGMSERAVHGDGCRTCPGERERERERKRERETDRERERQRERETERETEREREIRLDTERKGGTDRDCIDDSQAQEI